MKKHHITEEIITLLRRIERMLSDDATGSKHVGSLGSAQRATIAGSRSTAECSYRRCITHVKEYRQEYNYRRSHSALTALTNMALAIFARHHATNQLGNSLITSGI